MIYKILSPGLSSKNNIWLTILTPKIYYMYILIQNIKPLDIRRYLGFIFYLLSFDLFRL